MPKLPRKTFRLNNFEVICTSNSECESKIQGALLIKKHNPELNKQLYAKGSSYFFILLRAKFVDW